MNASNSTKSWTEDLAARPEVFPYKLDLINDTLLLVELSAADISAASFLDQRVLKQTTKGAWVSWGSVAECFDDVPALTPASFIFHVGHCGSTLLSRLLQIFDTTQSLREPLPLRTLAQDVANFGDGRSFLTQQAQLDRLQVLSKMWSRGASHTVIKATSICSDLLSHLHSIEATTKSMFVYNKVETHIATLLAGENALIDLKGFAQLRLQRIQQKTDLEIQLSQLTLGQLAALSWLSEATSVTQFLTSDAGQPFTMEFEQFISKPAESLSAILSYLTIPFDNHTIEKAVGSNVLQTYSKAPEHKYNAQTRAAILDDSRLRYREDIHGAIDWLEGLARQSELVATSLQKFS